MLRLGILVSGGGTNLQAIIDNIENGALSNTKITTVISNKEKAHALVRARQYNIDACCLSPKDYPDKESFDCALRDYFINKEVDLIVLAGYLVVLGERFVSAFPNKIINIHPSLIPSFCGAGYYGLRVHEAVLERGVKITGATVHFVDKGTDTGPIILQKAVEVLPTDTKEILQKRVMLEAEWVLLPKAIQLYGEGKIKVKDGKVYIS